MVRPFVLVAVLAMVSLRTQPAWADEKVDALARDAAEAFSRALIAEDAKALLKAADVPWWWDENNVTTERRALQKQLQAVLDGQDFSDEKIRVTVIAPLPRFEEAIRKKLPEGRRKKLEAVLGQDHRMVLIEVEKADRKGKGVLAVRVKDGKARVVGIVKY